MWMNIHMHDHKPIQLANTCLWAGKHWYVCSQGSLACAYDMYNPAHKPYVHEHGEYWNVCKPSLDMFCLANIHVTCQEMMRIDCKHNICLFASRVHSRTLSWLVLHLRQRDYITINSVALWWVTDNDIQRLIQLLHMNEHLVPIWLPHAAGNNTGLYCQHGS